MPTKCSFTAQNRKLERGRPRWPWFKLGAFKRPNMHEMRSMYCHSHNSSWILIAVPMLSLAAAICLVWDLEFNQARGGAQSRKIVLKPQVPSDDLSSSYLMRHLARCPENCQPYCYWCSWRLHKNTYHQSQWKIMQAIMMKSSPMRCSRSFHALGILRAHAAAVTAVLSITRLHLGWSEIKESPSAQHGKNIHGC